MSFAGPFWDIQLRDIINFLILIATIVAIYVGPIRAVKITRDNDEARESRRRKFAIFTNLMKTRRSILDPVHVAALNLVEVEFNSDESVIRSYRDYLNQLNKPIPSGNSPDETDRFTRDREDLLFDLIHAIGVNLDFSYDKRDLRKFAYAPQGWQSVETEQFTFRRLVIELLNGHRGLPVKPFSEPNDKFPPPP